MFDEACLLGQCERTENSICIADTGGRVVRANYSLFLCPVTMVLFRVSPRGRDREEAWCGYHPETLSGCRCLGTWRGVPLAKRPLPRQEYRLVELKRWSDHLGIPINLHPKYFPADETLAARTIIAVQDDGRDVSDLTET